jgi:NADH:ubiquinone oxidoreductase subunit 4 (subunit M)
MLFSVVGVGCSGADRIAELSARRPDEARHPANLEPWLFAGFLVAFIEGADGAVHTWLPDVAEQATPAVDPAGRCARQIGTFGMLRFARSVPEASRNHAVMIVLAVISILYGRSPRSGSET